MNDSANEKYFFNKLENVPSNNSGIDEEILKKALKLKRASELGDNKIFATQKYHEFLIDNSLENFQINEYEKRDIKKQPESSKKVATINGVNFYSVSEFVLYYEKLTFPEKLKVAMQIIKGEHKK